MLVVAILWIVFAFGMMDVPINMPSIIYDILRTIYRIYPIVMAGLFVVSFLVK